MRFSTKSRAISALPTRVSRYHCGGQVAYRLSHGETPIQVPALRLATHCNCAFWFVFVRRCVPEPHFNLASGLVYPSLIWAVVLSTAGRG